ncbi:MAG: AAA family ATPase [Thermoguttaceae bacterium]|jgi:CO dehydrogenase maturation factor|nr:AAA family ATPase [Thermoguttaceae bacterium]
MALSIAVAGKGGTGKTTFASLLVRALVEQRVRPVLAVDADPNANLGEALGMEPGLTLAEIRERGSTPEGSPASGIGRVRAVEDELQRALAEAEGFDLLTMGRPEGPRCYCAVNHLLRQSLDTLARNYAAVVVDNEAGMEHLSRRTTNDIDFLIAVLNPTVPSLRAVRRILELSRELPVRIGHRVVLATRVAPEGVPAPIERDLTALDVERLPDVPQDDAVERAGAEGHDVFAFGAGSPALEAVRQIAARLCSTLVTPPV